MRIRPDALVLSTFWFLLAAGSGKTETILGEEPALGPAESRVQQSDLQGMSLHDIRHAGLKMFATEFRRADGYGDGPVSVGGRPTLQDNGTFLRVNGLDSQSCLGCHDVVSAAEMPAIAGIGGSDGISNNAMFMTRAIDVADFAGNGFAAFDGRLINPPALFGTGGVQQVGKEMTQRLQRLKRRAIKNPGQRVDLRAKGVEFGYIIADYQGKVDTTNVVGVDPDLVVRPFGRKGEFATVRGFDLDALMFHFGMQPVEAVGENVDDDGDGVVNEVTIGEISALEIFVTTQERPVQTYRSARAQSGFRRFRKLGCADCHRPDMTTKSHHLTYSFPEIDTRPFKNEFYDVDLRDEPAGFESSANDGIVVPMFSDLKRHDMGADLAESFHAATPQQNREFITAKLWGVADTAPYLHDGRAQTLNQAILLHGGEALAVRDRYAGLSVAEKNEILAFLGTLRNPRNPNADVSGVGPQ